MRSRKASGWLAFVFAALLLGAAPSPGAAESENSREPSRAKPSEQAAPGRKRASRGDDKVVLVLTGVIQPGAYRQFRAAIAGRNPAVIVLDSPGGVLGEALLIGDEVRRRGLNTLVGPNGSCASACAVVFLSGRTKFMGKGAEVGLHSAYSLDGRASPQATQVMASYLSGVGVPSSILKRMARTAPSDIRWLTKSEQKALRIQAMK